MLFKIDVTGSRRGRRGRGACGILTEAWRCRPGRAARTLTRLTPWPLAVLAALPFHVAGAQAANPSCSASATDMNFGTVDLSSGASFSASSVTISCNGGDASRSVTFCVSIGEGNPASGTGSPRSMGGSQGVISYDLYRDPAHTQVFGSYTGSASAWPGQEATATTTPSGSAVAVVNVHGEIPRQQSAAVGSYSAQFTPGHTQLTYGYSSDGDCQSNTWTTPPQSFSFQVLADYAATCAVSASNLAFPDASILNANVDGSSTLTVRCSNGTPYTVGLGLGLGTGVSEPTARKMTSGAGEILYGLYRDAARTQPWGPSTPYLYSATGAGTDQSVPVYGRVRPQASPAPGNYSDTIIATVTY